MNQYVKMLIGIAVLTWVLVLAIIGAGVRSNKIPKAIPVKMEDFTGFLIMREGTPLVYRVKDDSIFISIRCRDEKSKRIFYDLDTIIRSRSQSHPAFLDDGNTIFWWDGFNKHHYLKERL